MKKRLPRSAKARRAFTMIELLTVIAIIAILAAILFPIFGTIREQARQSNTMTNMHAVYLGARLYAEDEGHFPQTLFGYAEVNDPNLNPPYAPALPGDVRPLNPMDEVKGSFRANAGKINETVIKGYLYRDQVKDYNTFLNADDAIKDRSAVTAVYWPRNSLMGANAVIQGGHLKAGTGAQVTWETTVDGANGCKFYGDPDIPNEGGYKGRVKLFYKMDSMDIGPMLDDYGNWVIDDSTQQPAYELHYSPDWTRLLGGSCDVDGNGNVLTSQLKYKNPPGDRTILTYSTHHAANAGSGRVIVLFSSGTARKIDVKEAFQKLPLYYK